MCNACAVAKLNKLGMQAFNNGDTQRAKFLLQQALQLSHTMGSKMFRAKLLHNLALVHQGADEPVTAIQCLRRAKELAEEQVAHPNPFTDRIRTQLSQLLAA